MRIVLGRQLGTRLASAEQCGALERDASTSVEALVRELDLDANPTIEVEISDQAPEMSVHVEGSPLTFDDALPVRVWFAMGIGSTRSRSNGTPSATRPAYPSDLGADSWLTWCASSWSAETPTVDTALIGYLAQLVRAIISQRPGCLARPDALAGQARDLGVPATQLADLIAPLLDLGIRLGDTDALRRTIGLGITRARSPADLVETMYTLARPGYVGIRVQPDDFADMFPELRTLEHRSVYSLLENGLQPEFVAVEDTLFNELGVTLSDIAWIPCRELVRGTIQIQINQSPVGPPLPVPAPDELVVLESTWLLDLYGIPYRASLGAGGTELCCIVNASYESALDNNDIRARTPGQVACELLKADVRRAADWVIGVEDVESQLASLRGVNGLLVQLVLDRFSIEDLTRYVRRILREGRSVRDLNGILERLLEHDVSRTDDALLDLAPNDEALVSGVIQYLGATPS